MTRAMATVAITLQGHEGISYACDWCFLQVSGRPGVQTFAIRKNSQPCLIHKAYAELRDERQQRLQRDSAQRRIAVPAGNWDTERQHSAISAPRKPQEPSPFGVADTGSVETNHVGQTPAGTDKPKQLRAPMVARRRGKSPSRNVTGRNAEGSARPTRPSRRLRYKTRCRENRRGVAALVKRRGRRASRRTSA